MTNDQQHEELVDSILEYIQENKVSTTEIADALGKKGELDRKIRAILPRTRAVGRVYYAPCFNESNYYTHYYLEQAPKKHIIYVEGIACKDKALIGELVCKYAILYKQSQGIIVQGYVRDVHNIIKESYPIWSYGTTPIGCINLDTGIDKEYYEKRKKELEGSIMVADDTGVIVILKHQLTEDFLQALKDMELQEDIWFDCLDRKKMSTFEIVCQQKYEQ